MAGVEFKVTWNKDLEKALKREPTAVMNLLAEKVTAGAIRRSPFKTGTNRRSIMWDSPKGGVRRIFTTSGYGGFLETGTGVFGPKKVRIFPKKKKVLSWIGSDGKRVFAAWSVGMPARPYMRRALEAVRKRAHIILRNFVK